MLKYYEMYAYLCPVVYHKPDAEEVAHWIYYESLFYISAMMHLLPGTIFHQLEVFLRNEELEYISFTCILPEEFVKSLRDSVPLWCSNGFTCYWYWSLGGLAGWRYLPSYCVTWRFSPVHRVGFSHVSQSAWRNIIFGWWKHGAFWFCRVFFV